MGVHEPTYYRWKKLSAGMSVSEIPRLNRLADKNVKAPRRKRVWRYRAVRPPIHGPNAVWALDFMSDRLFSDRPFRILTVEDCHTRGALSIAPRANFRAFRVVEVAPQLIRARGRPVCLRADYGPEFADRPLDQWAHLNGVSIDFSRPGKPTDNAHIESIIVRLRAEVSTPHCSYRLPTLASASKPGGATTTTIDRTPPWAA
jgi:transposase InsO family protein